MASPTTWTLAAIMAALVAGLLWSPNPYARLNRRRSSLASLEGAVRTRWRGARHDAVGVAVIDLLVAMSAEVRAVTDFSRAFERAVHESAALSSLRRDDLAQHSQRTLRLLEVVWQVHDQTGGPTAQALSTLIELARADLRVQRTISAESSAARATAVVLMALTPLAWLVGAALGAEPVAWLVGSPLGIVVLIVGVLMTGLGCGTVLLLIHRVRVHVRDAS